MGRAHCVNLDESLYVPVARGFWKQKELWDGTYTITDWFDIMEIIQVNDENERRAREEQKLMQQMQQ